MLGSRSIYKPQHQLLLTKEKEERGGKGKGFFFPILVILYNNIRREVIRGALDWRGGTERKRRETGRAGSCGLQVQHGGSK